MRATFGTKDAANISHNCDITIQLCDYFFVKNHNLLIRNILYLIMERILENIEAIRKEKGLKQSDMARELNVSQSAYSNIITRNTDIYLGKLSQIADILGVSVIDIITYPKKYVDVDQIALESTTGKVAVMFEVSPSRRDSLIKMVIEDKNK